MIENTNALPKPGVSSKTLQSDNNFDPESAGPDQSSSANILRVQADIQSSSPIHRHIEEYDGSQLGGYAPEPPQSQQPSKSNSQSSNNDKKAQEETHAENTSMYLENTSMDTDMDMYTGPNTSMSVNTGTPFGYDDHMPIGHLHHEHEHEHEREFGMTTPQKNLLSPPAVTRKINGGDDDEKQKIPQMKLFRETPSVRNRSNFVAVANADSEKMNEAVTVPFKMDYAAEATRIRIRKDAGIHININDKDDQEGIDTDADKEETSSLVSEYGSEVGEMKLRLEDVNAMDALAEEGEEEEIERDADEGNRVDERERQDKDESHTHQNGERLFHVDGGLSFGASPRRRQIDHPAIRVNVDDHSDDNDTDDGDLSQDFSVDSVDLASQIDGLNIEHVAKAMNEAEDTEGGAPARRVIPVLPSTPVAKRAEAEPEPSTPIGAVSAALRRFGNGVSNMRRFTKSPSGEAQSYHKHDDGFIYKQQEEVSGVWLSPRFANQKNSVAKGSIHQPRIVGTPSRSVKKRSGVTPLSGMTSCLSFDPESGRQPYGFMRLTDSPPSSPLPTHRKTKSFGSSGSEFFVDSMKELYQNEQVQVLDPRSMKTSNISGFQRPDGTGFQPIRPLEGVLSPKRRDASSPRGGSRYAGERQHASTPKSKINKKQVFLLQSPQRGDIEREDALDLLSLFVERSVAFHENSSASTPDQLESQEESSDSDSKTSDDVKSCVDALREISKCHVGEGEGEDKLYPSHKDRLKVLDSLENYHTYAMEMKQAALSASTWLNAIGRTGKSASIGELCLPNSSEFISEETMRQMDIDELRPLIQATHSQLVEKNDMNDRLDRELSVCRAEIGRLKTLSRNETSFLSPDKSILDTEVGDESSASSSASSQNEFPTDSDVYVDIDVHSESGSENKQSCHTTNTTAASMAGAKKEILLLKAELEETNRMLKTMEQEIKWPKPRIDESRNTDSIAISNKEEAAKSKDDDGDSPEFANNQKESLGETTLIDAKDPPESTTMPMTSQEQSGYEENTSILMDALKEELEDYVTAVRKGDYDEINCLKKKIEHFESIHKNDANPEQKMINVRMLNAENFTTEWDKLCPLPPPPDHDLRSPIVSDLLSQWTTDVETQKSLLLWVEKILSGQDCNDIPPLKLSGLDHQVREGFTMHILPFLLRRSDIHVEVTTRAHRKTSYDISVTISRPHDSQQGSIEIGSQQRSTSKAEIVLTPKNPHMMAFKASNTRATLDNSGETSTRAEKGGFRGYTASALETGSVTSTTITAHISNHMSSSKMNRLERSHGISSPLVENDHSIHVSSANVDQTPQQQQGMMAGALNAMGGFISRRRTPGSHDNELSKKNSLKSSLMTPQSSHVTDTTSDMQEESQPYHRVVSAPPGRIGMTFVQYRGHAMISDVYKNSPLAGWVFPSDILIAIDEVPVSGMRVPEIVKLLTARKEQQRALRVISSHAMSELLITEDQSP